MVNLHPAVQLEPAPLPALIAPAAPRPARGLGLDRPVAAPSEPPQIEVRIGTIEIRAANPPAQPARPAPPQPQGFDEYARIRSYQIWED